MQRVICAISKHSYHALSDLYMLAPGGRACCGMGGIAAAIGAVRAASGGVFPPFYARARARGVAQCKLRRPHPDASALPYPTRCATQTAPVASGGRVRCRSSISSCVARARCAALHLPSALRLLSRNTVRSRGRGRVGRAVKATDLSSVMFTACAGSNPAPDMLRFFYYYSFAHLLHVSPFRTR